MRSEYIDYVIPGNDEPSARSSVTQKIADASSSVTTWPRRIHLASRQGATAAESMPVELEPERGRSGGLTRTRNFFVTALSKRRLFLPGRHRCLTPSHESYF